MALTFFQLEERIVYDASGAAVVVDALVGAEPTPPQDGEAGQAGQGQQDSSDQQNQQKPEEDTTPQAEPAQQDTHQPQSGALEIPPAVESSTQWDQAEEGLIQQPTEAGGSPTPEPAEGSQQNPQALFTEPLPETDDTDDDAGLAPASEGGEPSFEQDMDQAVENPDQTGAELVFIDSGLTGAEEIASQVGEGKTVHTIDSQSDGLAQIKQALAETEGVSAIHIISHGESGHIRLGEFDLNSNTVETRADDLAAIGRHLSDGGDILFYGCDVAQGETGESLIDAISEKTGADVAASDDLTGGEGQDADIELEYRTGDIEADNVLAGEFQQNYDGVLDDPSPFTEATSVDDLVNQLVEGSNIQNVNNVTQGGVLSQASTFEAVNLGTTPEGDVLTLTNGILITSGDGTPPTSNTSGSYSGRVGGPGDDDVENMAGVSDSQDAFYIEFDFEVPEGKNAVYLDLMFGSDEYPEYMDSICDGAAVIVDGVNYAKFENGTPLKVVSDADFNDNTGSSYGIEYDGITDVMRVVAKLDMAQTTHTIKIVIADTSDTSYDSGLFLSTLKAAYTSGEGGIGGEVTESEPVSDIILNNNSVSENSKAGTAVSTLTAKDSNGNTLENATYSIVGSNGYFAVSGDKLVVKAGADLDYESGTAHKVTIKAVDGEGNTYTETFNIRVGNVAEAPTSLNIGSNEVAENSPAGTVVAGLSAGDPEGGPYTYSIEGGSNAFAISGDKLVVKDASALDYETAKSEEVTIRVTDSTGLSLTKTFTIGITDVADSGSLPPEGENPGPGSSDGAGGDGTDGSRGGKGPGQSGPGEFGQYTDPSGANQFNDGPGRSGDPGPDKIPGQNTGGENDGDQTGDKSRLSQDAQKDNIFFMKDSGLRISPDLLFEMVVGRIDAFGQGEVATQEHLNQGLRDDIDNALEDGNHSKGLRGHPESASRKVIADAIDAFPDLNHELTSKFHEVNSQILDLAFDPSTGRSYFLQARDALDSLQKLMTHNFEPDGRVGQLIEMWVNVLERSVNELSNQGFDVSSLESKLQIINQQRN